jgi:hypothetical protein
MSFDGSISDRCYLSPYSSCLSPPVSELMQFLLTFFVYFFPFKGCSRFSFRLEIALGIEILVFGDSSPLSASTRP